MAAIRRYLVPWTMRAGGVYLRKGIASVDPTEDPQKAEALEKAKGVRFLEEVESRETPPAAKPEPVQAPVAEEAEGPDLDEMTKAEMSLMAEDMGLDVPNRARKAEIRSLIEAALE